MSLQRDNDEERAAVIDRMLQDQRRKPGAARVKTERLVERRRRRSDLELRAQRVEIERVWRERHHGAARKRSA
jgi:hypothetical protein